MADIDDEHIDECDSSDAHVVLPHPQFVRPLGSLMLAADGANLRDTSLGALVALPDELLLRVLGMGGAPALARCACASRGLRVLAYHDELWKQYLLENLPSSSWLRWDARGWRHAYLRHVGVSLPAASPSDDASSLFARGPRYYSDVLHAPWHCGTAAIPRRWSQHSNNSFSIPRVAASSLSVDEFARRFEQPGKPVILTGLTDSWPAAKSWSFDSLRARFGNGAGFHVGGHTMGLSDFFDYSMTNTDEQPLYLFDKHFRETSAAHGHALADDYTVPSYFAADRDLFASLPTAFRPDHAWLIAGGTRSGSGWHVDPNQTSAWNACICGTKKWILTPPGHPPPGVNASSDGASVVSPISLFEWFRVFYAYVDRMRREAQRSAPPAGPPTDTRSADLQTCGQALEATVTEGELLFVPAGWWHCCLNLEPAIAITGNYAPASSASSVLQYVRAGDRAGDLVSGLPDELRPLLADEFEAVCKQRCPEALVAPTLPASAEAADVTRPPPPEASAPATALVGREEVAEFRFSFG